MRLDIHCSEPNLMGSYLLPDKESSPTKLIISEASSQDKPSWRLSNSLTKLTYQLTKSSSKTHTSKKPFLQEEDTKYPFTSKNKQLSPQSQRVIPNPIEPTHSKSLKTYLRTLTWTEFIVTRRTNTSTLEESSPDSTIRKEKTSGT